MKTIKEEIIDNLKKQGFSDIVKYDAKGKATHFELGRVIEKWG